MALFAIAGRERRSGVAMPSIVVSAMEVPLRVSATTEEKTVEVREYLRCRLGVWQTISAHKRRRPHHRRGR